MAETKLKRWLRHRTDGTIYVYDERMATNPSVEEVVAYNVEEAGKNPSVAEIATLTPERLIVMTRWQLIAFAWVRLGTTFPGNWTRDMMLKGICDKLGIETPHLELSEREKKMAAAITEVPVDPAPAAPEPAPTTAQPTEPVAPTESAAPGIVTEPSQEDSPAVVDVAVTEHEEWDQVDALLDDHH